MQAISRWPKSLRKTSSCPGSSTMWCWLLGSHKQTGQVCSVGISGCHGWIAMGCWCFPLTHPWPWPRCHIQASPLPKGPRSPWGSWEGPPLPPGFQGGVETATAWSARHTVCWYPWPEGSLSISSPCHDGLGNPKGTPAKNTQATAGCYLKNPKATGNLIVHQSAAPAHFSGYGVRMSY